MFIIFIREKKRKRNEEHMHHIRNRNKHTSFLYSNVVFWVILGKIRQTQPPHQGILLRIPLVIAVTTYTHPPVTISFLFLVVTVLNSYFYFSSFSLFLFLFCFVRCYYCYYFHQFGCYCCYYFCIFFFVFHFKCMVFYRKKKIPACAWYGRQVAGENSTNLIVFYILFLYTQHFNLAHLRVCYCYVPLNIRP